MFSFLRETVIDLCLSLHCRQKKPLTPINYNCSNYNIININCLAPKYQYTKIV